MPTATTTATNASSGVIEGDGAGQASNQERWSSGPADGVHFISDAEGFTRSFVNRMMRLTLLAPDIAETILEGRHAKRLMLKELMGSMPSVWEEQRQRFARPRSKPTNCLQDDP